MNDQVKSAARVLDLLELLSSQSDPMRLGEIAATLAIPKSSVHGLLATLLARGYVERDSADRYAVVENFRRGFGWVGGHEAMLRAVAAPIVEDVRDQVDETVFLAVPTPQHDARLIYKAVSTQAVRYDAANTVSPGYATVMGRVLLAHKPPEVIDRYLAETDLKPIGDHTITDPDEIRALLAAIRRDGFGTIVDEYALGGAGIGVPVRRAGGEVIAVLDIATVTPRYQRRRAEMLRAAQDGAARISARMGYRAAAAPAEAEEGTA